MPKQYCFKIWRAGKVVTEYYKICHDEIQALSWIGTKARAEGWGEAGLDWEIQSMTDRSIVDVYEHDWDKSGFLSEIVEEINAREVSVNYGTNAELRGLSYVDLCEAAIEILEYLKGEGENVAL